MASTEERILLRLATFHEYLNQLSLIANKNWYQGGMTWRAEYRKRESKLFTDLPRFEPNLTRRVQEWSTLLWFIHGCPRDDPDRPGDMTPHPDDVKVFEPMARRQLSEIKPKNGIEESRLLIELSGRSWAGFDFAFIVGRNAVLHTGMWSVD